MWMLACISHKISTAAAQRTMSTALHSLRSLDILSSMSAGSSVARLVSTALCTASLRNSVRNAGWACDRGPRESGLTRSVRQPEASLQAYVEESEGA